jgi:WhiB family transcriptional regulator, redox-sensing transcriptional regulator
MEVETAYLRLAKAIHESPIVVPCNNTDPEIWFGDQEEGYDYSALAKQLCKACPARKPCAEYAIVAKEQFGIWGGTSPKQRQRIRNPRAA